jgi:hypothetical protein
MRHVNGTREKNGTWGAVVAAVALGYFGTASTSFADTYNFYFSKGKKKPVTTQGIVEESGDEGLESDVSSDAYERRERAQAPIIINNNLGGAASGDDFRRDFSPPESSSYHPENDSEKRPPAKPVGSASGASSATTVVAAATPKSDEASSFRFGMSAARWGFRGNGGALVNVEGDGGVVFTLGIDFTRSLGMNIFGGAVRESFWPQANVDGTSDVRMMLGAEVQVLPFRLDVGSFDLLQLGFVAGTSTLGQSSLGALVDPGQIHLGMRFNLNLGSSFGLTTVARANGRFAMAEVGLVGRL